MKRYWIPLTVLAIAGLLASVVLTVMEGVKYRLREDQGLDPIYAPDWVASLTIVGLWAFVLAMLGLTVTSVVALLRLRRRRAST